MTRSLTLRQIVSRIPCVACIQSLVIADEARDWLSGDIEKKPKISDPHHVTTRGAGGGDTPDNLMPLCREHHNAWDAPWGGPSFMIRTYAGVRGWLEAAGRTDVLEKFGLQPADPVAICSHKPSNEEDACPKETRSPGRRSPRSSRSPSPAKRSRRRSTR